MVRYADPVVADAFIRSRVRGEHARAYGTLPPDIDFAHIIERHRPTLP